MSSKIVLKYRRCAVSFLLASLTAQALACGGDADTARARGPKSSNAQPTRDAGAPPVAPPSKEETKLNPPDSGPLTPPDEQPEEQPDTSSTGADAGGEPTPDAEAPAPRDAQVVEYAIWLSPAPIAAGTVVRLRARAIYADGSIVPVTNPEELDWSSSDNGVARITREFGSLMAFGVTAGTTTITARARSQNGAQGATLLAVKNSAVTAVAVKGDRRSLPKGESTQFAAVANFDDGSQQDVSVLAEWSANPPDAVAFDRAIERKGSFRTNAEGAVLITASFGGKQGKLEVTVGEPVPVALAIPGETRRLPLGTTMWLAADGTLTDGTSKSVTGEVTWTSSNPGVVFISNDGSKGFLTAVSKGTATVTATSANGVSATAEITVIDAAIVDTRFTPAEATIARDSTRRFKLVASNTDGDEIDLSDAGEWSSSDPAVATVSNVGRKGIVAGAKAGVATISVKLGEKTYFGSVTVQ